MTLSKCDLHHWQDTPEDRQKCDSAFERIKDAGLLNELELLLDKCRSNVESDIAYQQSLADD